MSAIIIEPLHADFISPEVSRDQLTPSQYLSAAFEHLKEDFFCSVWRSTHGKWDLENTENEYCYLNRGTVILTDESGATITLTAGQAFTIPAGFKGTWETVDDCEKYYALFSESILSA